jgi:isopenicillin-N N-acyltransferase-like protein
MQYRAALTTAVFVAMLCGSAAATKGNWTNCSGVQNPFPVHKAPPVFVRQVTNGKRYLGGADNDTFHVLHLYGSHYDMGYAHGQLLGEYFDEIYTLFITYVESQITEHVPSWVPAWLVDLVGEYGVPGALQITVDWTKPFTPQMYIDEMHGIADGSGFDFDKVYQVNMFPELIKAACTIVGATGTATSNGKIAHLRDLDFGTSIPVKNWPLVAVLHGDGTQPAVVNFGWALLVGSLTGISSNPIGIGEKVWLGNDAKQYDGVKGQPWMFILRDVLYTKNIEQALATMRNANRTCAIHVGVGDGSTNKFRGVQMAADAFEVFNWTSISYSEHPIIEDVMYWDKHEQPTHSWCLSTLLKELHGTLTAEVLATTVSAVGETGDFHSVAFDYEGMTAYFSNARKTNVTVGSEYAYARQYTFLNISALIAEAL